MPVGHRDQFQTKHRNRVDVGSKLARQTFALCAPRQRSFVTFGRNQVALDFGGADFALFVRQCVRVVAFGGNLAVQRGNQRIFVQPHDHGERIRCFGVYDGFASGIVDLRCQPRRRERNLVVSTPQ